jgi:hypothetical protein
VVKMAISKKLIIALVIVVIRIDPCISEYKLKKFMKMEIFDGIEMPRVIKTSKDRKYVNISLDIIIIYDLIYFMYRSKMHTYLPLIFVRLGRIYNVVLGALTTTVAMHSDGRIIRNHLYVRCILGMAFA